MSGGNYTQDEAARLFQQYGDATTPTLYYANGSDADVFNTSSDEFGNYSVGPSEHDTRIMNPSDPSLPENRGGYSGYKYPIDKPPGSPTLTTQQILLYAGLAVAALILVPPLLNRR